jgi:hypothetical protein
MYSTRVGIWTCMFGNSSATGTAFGCGSFAVTRLVSVAAALAVMVVENRGGRGPSLAAVLAGSAPAEAMAALRYALSMER